MKKTHLAAAIAGALIATAAGAESASAQTVDWPLGSELRGATVQVQFADGIVNTVNFYPDGTARIEGPGGAVANGTWTVGNGQLCLTVGAESECWPYQTAFVNGQPVVLTSDCASTSTWIAQMLQQPPPPMEQRSGERG